MSTTTQTDAALDAIRHIDFDWCVRLSDVWLDAPGDVASLHSHQRKRLCEHLDNLLSQTASPFSLPIIGEGGSGKTHLLSFLRQQPLKRNATFVLVDMTDVQDFWVTTLQGYVDSLQHNLGEHDQQSLILQRFLGKASKDAVEETLGKLKGYTPARLKKNINNVIKGLAETTSRQLVLRHQDVIRAICCLNSDNFETQSIGLTWLQGQELEAAQKRALGFQTKSESCRHIVQGLSWFISLTGPTVVAFDQLDPIVHQTFHQSTARLQEQEAARSIVQDIGNGFATLRELAWTWPVVSCIESTWARLTDTVMQALTDRFDSPQRLLNADDSVAQRLIKRRLKTAFDRSGFQAPHDTWPFEPDALSRLDAKTPRELLQGCHKECQNMLTQQQVWEVAHFGETTTPINTPIDVAQLDEQFEHLRIATTVDEYLDERQEDQQLAPLLVTAIRALLVERAQQIPSSITPVIDEQFSGNTNAVPLHARLRLIFHDENEREEHYSLRSLQRSNPMAFQNRLRAAINHAGISDDLSFRHLTILRSGPVPSGPVTATLKDTLEHAGGRIHELTDEEVQVLVAVNIMFEDKDPLLEAWLKQRRPISSLAEFVRCLFHGSVLAEPSDIPPPDHEPVKTEVTSTEIMNTTQTDDESIDERHTDIEDLEPEPLTIPLGRTIDRSRSEDLIRLPIANLARHTMIMGASGSGKSVTVRRLVEGAALAGIPSVIIDGAGDMCTFEQPRSTASPHWLYGDDSQAKRFHKVTEQVIYTPGARSGRPLSLTLIPDFVALRDNQEVLATTIDMVVASITELAATGTKEKISKKSAILAGAVTEFARTAKECSLSSFIDFLCDVPERARLNIQREDQLCREVIDCLKIQQVQNPLLRHGGEALDPHQLFSPTATGRTPVTAISMAGLPEQSQRCTFVNQLAMLLFRWLKANPTPKENRPLHGLLVIDEARDFVPSGKDSACKESMRTLAAQARKYGLGLVLATQHPKDVDTKIVGNCGTQMYGRMGSPASLNAAKEFLGMLGLKHPKIADLTAGQFWVHSADGSEGARLLQFPESLSQPSTLTADEILSKSAR
ncbi:MAG: ATP-binding protein [Planctomycetaceae bacterium]|nr:ATP-binding protein [Planctomycetaceae bacterium]